MRVLHYLMHKPTFPFVERSRFFQFIKRHHRIHHVHMNRNLNVLIPLADLMLGTFVAEMPSARTTPESARLIARRHSSRGRSQADGETIQERKQASG
jgi:sterol desaturase/sphingolipid hydroxylase (fatty acid hydroxylase superfamily)